MSRRVRLAVTIAVPVLVIAAFLLKEQLLGLAKYAGPCMFYTVTGFHCPGCGNTRSVRAMLGGHFLTAVRNNPAIPFLSLFLAAIYGEIAGGLFGKRLRLFPRNMTFWWVILGLFGAFYIVRNFVPILAPIE